MKLLIAGSRTITSVDKVIQAIKQSKFTKPDEIISGGAIGVDTCAELIAKKYGIKFTKFPAQWDIYGKSAGYIRNKQMVEYCDKVIIVWDGISKGSKHTIDLCKSMNKPHWVRICKGSN